MSLFEGLHIRQFGDKVKEARLRWYGHVQRQNAEYVGRRIYAWSHHVKGKEEDLRRGSWMW